MPKSYESFKKEFGKTCNTGAVTTIIAALVTPRVLGQTLPLLDTLILLAIAACFWFVGLVLLTEKKTEPRGEGKWKRVRVKKDTTIHILDESI